jgi:hypothetical protein
VSLFIASGLPGVVIVVFGIVALAAAARFAIAPDVVRLGHIAAVCVALMFASFAGAAACFATVAEVVPQHPEWTADGQLGIVVLGGVGESLSPLILGFSTIAAVALITAVGVRKLPPAAIAG